MSCKHQSSFGWVLSTLSLYLAATSAVTIPFHSKIPLQQQQRSGISPYYQRSISGNQGLQISQHDPGDCFNMPLTWPGSAEVLPPPDPPKEKLKNIYTLEAKFLYECFKEEDGQVRPRIARFETVGIYDMGPLLHQDPEFLQRYISQPADEIRYTKGLKVRGLEMVRGGTSRVPARMALKWNGNTFFVGTARQKGQRIPAPSKIREDSLDWVKWTADAAATRTERDERQHVINHGVTAVYEINTASGRATTKDCQGGKEFVEKDFSSQLWVMGPDEVKGFTGQGTPRSVCLAPQGPTAGRGRGNGAGGVNAGAIARAGTGGGGVAFSGVPAGAGFA